MIKDSLQLFKEMILGRSSTYASVNRGSLGCLSSLTFIILRALFWALWTMTSMLLLSCPQPWHADVCQKKEWYNVFKISEVKRGLILARILFALFCFCFKASMWSFESKCSSVWSNGLVVKALDSPSRVLVFKTTRWLQDRFSLSSFRGP